MRVRTMLVGAVAAVAMAVSACGSSGSDSAGATGPVADLGNLLSQSVSHQNSAHFQMQTSLPGLGAETGSGAIQYGNPAAMDISLSTPQGPMEMVMVGDALYIKNQAIAASAAPGKPWLKLSLANNGAATVLLQNTDVSQMVKQLIAAGTVNSVSHEQLNGENTTHYSITVDVNKMSANQSDPTLKGLYNAMSQAGMSTYTVDIWLNSQNLPVKAVNTTPVADATSGKTVPVVSTITFSDWGKAVTVQAPPADQVTAVGGG